MGLGYGQVSGVDVFNTFAPVVNSITVRSLLALAFILTSTYISEMYHMLSV